MRKNILLIVSLLEGKNFAPRKDHQIAIDVSFGGEILTTDPVEAVEKPVFDAELAWELDRQGLHLHRLQRSPLKLQCFLCNRQGRKLENLGYLILDIRNSKENQAEHTWSRLLNTKSDEHKPELLLGVYLEYDSAKKDSVVESRTENVAVPLPLLKPAPALSVPKVKGTFTSEYLKPKLNSEEGYYLIGPQDLCTEYFSLSVTLVFAENLAQLVEPDEAEKFQKNYAFQYFLLGNNVRTEIFHDLSKADFPAERAAVRIRSSSNALRSFLKKQQSLNIVLLCDDATIAEATVPIDSLLTIGDERRTVEGIFCLLPIRKSPSVISAGIGVCVALQREITTQLDGNHSRVSDGKQEAVDIRKNSAALGNKRKKSVASSDSPQDSLDAIPTWNNNQSSETKLKSHESQKSLKHDLTSANEEEKSTRGKPKESLKRTGSNFDKEGEMQVAQHFHFILDLKTLSMDSQVEAFPCFLRYSYPFFGTSAPIMTHPSVRALPLADVNLPHGYCSFDFVTSTHNLQNTFRDIPLIVEVLEEVSGYPDGRLVGMVKVCLHPVLESPSTRVVAADGKASEKRSISSQAPIVSPDGKSQGTLKVVMGLDDHGPADLSKLFAQTPPNLFGGEVSRQKEMVPLVMELELWKEKQEVLFREQLRTKEQEHLRTLTAEWKERDVERELLVQTKLQECREHEERLKRALQDVEFRERQLSRREAAVNASKAEAELRAQRAEEEARDSARRVRSDCEHRLEIEKERTKGALEEKSRLQAALAEKEVTLETLRERLQGSDEIRLRSELEISNLEKGELKRKLDAVTIAKNRYKEQWAKALKRISALQQKMHSAGSSAVIQLDETTLEGEKRALAKIKEEVEALKRRIQDTSESSVSDEYVRQLRDERDMLLSTGVYSKTDRIVVELDKHIADASLRIPKH